MTPACTYPYSDCGRWLAAFLRRYPRSAPLICRATAVAPEGLTAAAKSPQLLSRVQWEILREATRGTAAWDACLEPRALEQHLHGLTEAMRHQHNVTPPKLAQLRRRNLIRLTVEHRYREHYGQRMGLSSQEVQALCAGRNTLGNRKAREYEARLQLPLGWFDHEDLPLPAETQGSLPRPSLEMEPPSEHEVQKAGCQINVVNSTSLGASGR